MRYYPAAIALSLAAVLSSSVGYSAQSAPVDPRVASLISRGQVELGAGRINEAIDSYEAALAIQPGSVPVLLELAQAARRTGLQGKALHYYRLALANEPQNLAAIAGEGAAFAEKGAIERARRNLTRLRGLCGESCDATRSLAAAIEKGPAPRVVTAQTVTPAPVIVEN
jgi:tetratricopeptide (TPR) repeat protein